MLFVNFVAKGLYHYRYMHMKSEMKFWMASCGQRFFLKMSAFTIKATRRMKNITEAMRR